MSNRFPHFKQLHSRDCGAVCLRMIAQYYGRIYTTEQLRSLANQQREGVTLLDISNAAEAIGMHTVGAQLTYARLAEDIPLPGVAHYKGNHFVVVVEANSKNVTIADPDLETTMTIPYQDFLQKWTGGGSIQDEGVILLMEPTADFFSPKGGLSTNEAKKAEDKTKAHLWQNLFQNKKLLWLLGFSVFAGAAITATVPFLLRMAVDEGIEFQNNNLLNVIIGAWLLLFIGRIGMDFVKRFIMFHVGSKAYIQLITGFMMKVLQLPVRFFESKMTDDVMQVFYDNQSVQRFYSRDLVSMVFSSLLLVLFSAALAVFKFKLFLILLAASIIQAFTIWLFLKRRHPLNYQRHEFSASHYNKLSDIVRGVKEIKLNSADKARRWVWEKSEAQLHRLRKEYSKSNDLYFRIPYYIGELRDIIIIYYAAVAAIEGNMSAGVLVAIIFILMQLNNPVKQVIDFFLGYLDTKMRIERMNEIYSLDEGTQEIKVNVLPETGNLTGENMSFRYKSANAPWILHNLSFTIPRGRTTVIVGPNGSGKSTLLNLLVNFLQPTQGIIRLSDIKLSEIKHSVWLSACGVVQQDGYIFNDTIASNIALGGEVVNSERLLEAARIANIMPFLEGFEDGFSTVVGESGKGLSKGQKQSILIARAVYNKPDFLFLDEATNDLDSVNERIVLSRILTAFKGKTVVIFASRKSLPIKVHHIIQLAAPKTSNIASNILQEKMGGDKIKIIGNLNKIISEN